MNTTGEGFEGEASVDTEYKTYFVVNSRLRGVILIFELNVK